MRDGLVLLIESSGRVGLVGVARAGVVVAERRLDGASKHARDLVPACRDVLDGVPMKELAGVAVSVGPGSYTGLRVGLMAAKALAYARCIPLIAVETFAVIAEQGGDAATVEVIADAQPPNVYHQRWTRGDGWQPAGAIGITPFETWLASRNATVSLTGPGCAAFAAKLGDAARVAETAQAPGLSALARLAERQFQHGTFADPFTLEPLYLRPSSAERLWDAKRQ